ncbi:hypothetical protein TIFTF001_030596 [Ficus carica]|uniref:Uncharacterized protein n=1 Tax=Ficus carica TaxID=3494 RepID=A0AA88DUH8_FICCA|nr:hypothetical protein TIFTF001_030596 [Ficus carica]
MARRRRGDVTRWAFAEMNLTRGGSWFGLTGRPVDGGLVRREGAAARSRFQKAWGTFLQVELPKGLAIANDSQKGRWGLAVKWLQVVR